MKTKVLNNKSKTQKYEPLSNSKNDSEKRHNNHLKDYTSLTESKYPMVLLHDILHGNSSILSQSSLVYNMETDRNRNNNLEITISKELSCSKPEEMKLPKKKKGRPRKIRIENLPKNKSTKHNESLGIKNNSKVNEEEECRLVPGIMNIKDKKNQIKLRECSVPLVRCTFKCPSDACEDKGLIAKTSKSKAHSVLGIQQVNSMDVNSLIEESDCRADISSTKDVSCSDSKDSKPIHECFTKKSNSLKKNESHDSSLRNTAKRKLPQIINNCVLPKNTFDASLILQNRLVVDNVHSFDKNKKQKHFGDRKESYIENIKQTNSNVETYNYPVIKSPKKINEETQNTQIICNQSMPLLDDTITDNENNNNDTENKHYFEHNFLKNKNSLKTDSNKIQSSKSESHTCINVEATTDENITDEDNQIDIAISDFFNCCMKNRISKKTTCTKQDHSNANEIGKISSHQSDVQQSTQLIKNEISETVHTKKNASTETNTDINVPKLIKCKEINETERLYNEEPIGVQSLTTKNLEKFNVIVSNTETTSYAEKYIKSVQETKKTVATDTNIIEKCENEKQSIVITSQKRGWAQHTDTSSEKANKKKIKLDRSSWKKRKLTESNSNTFQSVLTDTRDTSNLSKPNASTINEHRKPISFHTGKSRTSNIIVIKPAAVENLAAEPEQHSLNLNEQSRRKEIVNVNKSPVEQSMSAEDSPYVTKNEDAVHKEKMRAKDKMENNNDSEDDDCISILCDPDVIDDLTKNLEENCTDLTDSNASVGEYTLNKKTWNNYVEKIKQEAEEDLKRFSDSNTYSDITFIKDTTIKPTETIKTQPVTSNNTVAEDSSKESHVASLPTRTNVKSRLGCEVTDKKENNISVTSQHIFYGLCFQKLQHGLCYRRNCTFNHNLNHDMLHLHEKNYEYIRAVIESAIKYEFRYFIQYMYNNVTRKIEPKQILDLCTLVRNANFLNNNCVQSTIESLIEKEKSIEEVINQLEFLSNEKEINTLYSMILPDAEKKIAFGKLWKTFRQFFIKSIPPVSYVRLIIQECLSAQDNETLIKDVAVNLINKLTIGYSQAPELRDILPLFFKLHDRITEVPRNSTSVNLQVEQDCSPFSANVNPLTKTLTNLDVESRSISSIKKSEQYVSQLLRRTNHNTVDTREPIFDPPCNLSTLESPVNSLDSTVQMDVYEGDRSNIPSNESTQIESGTTNNSPEVTDVPWVIHRIENLPAPSSPYQHRFWKFNIDLTSLREGIRHKDYKHVLQILEKYSKYENNIFLKGCYNMLRNNIMSSSEHLVNIIKISVQTGMSSTLEESLFTLGRYFLTELADNALWVLAYKLLKTLQIYESRFNVGFILLSVEIYIANGRPLKALEILRQTNVIFTNRKKWKMPSESRDEDLRVMIIPLLLESLCGNFVESAFALYDTLLGDQYCIYFPIDLPHCIDKLALALLTAEKHDLIIELARLLIPYNLMLRPNIFRAVIVTATTRDIILAKQLFQYGTKLGTYRAIKLNAPILLIVNTSWTEEEMYLAVTELIQQLFMEIGHAIDHIGVRQLAVYVSFETILSSRELQLSKVRKYDNKRIISSSRQVMENILKNRFDPPLGFVKSNKDKVAKFSSSKLLNYMKSTHVAL